MNCINIEQRNYELTQHNVAKFILLSERITMDSTVGEIMNVNELDEQLWNKVKDSSTFTGEDNELRKLFARYHKIWQDKWQRGEFFSTPNLSEPDYWDIFGKQSNDKIVDLCLNYMICITSDLAYKKNIAEFINDLKDTLYMIDKISVPQSIFERSNTDEQNSIN